MLSLITFVIFTLAGANSPRSGFPRLFYFLATLLVGTYLILTFVPQSVILAIGFVALVSLAFGDLLARYLLSCLDK